MVPHSIASSRHQRHSRQTEFSAKECIQGAHTVEQADANKYKDTILLPKTDFPMKGNLPEREPGQVNNWNQENIYAKRIAKNKGRPLFTMPDGPPYANGNIHLGHVLNKVLKDIVIKYKNMQGFLAPFIPGWDCHGLPIELKVTKALGPKRLQMTNSEIRDLCRKEAHKWVATQKQQFVRLGVLADWENPYLTLHANYEADEIRVLAKILDNGLLYRGEKPVYWCPALQTALAAAEVEYHDHKSPSIYVKFELLQNNDQNNDQFSELLGQLTPVSMVIWTTTPWTLPANYGIAVHRDFTYGIYHAEQAPGGPQNFIIGNELQESFEQATGIQLKLLKTVSGAELEGLKAQHPFIKDRQSLVIHADHVTMEKTGLVHTAPGHGLDDYQAGLKYGLPVYSPVNEAGKFIDDVEEFAGMKIWDANPKICDRMKATGHLLAYSEFVHSYPHNPRSKTPLIFRATPQWFIRMDDERFNLRETALNAIEEQIQFFPKWGKQRLQAMVQNTPDWCLSRQRMWGVPIPVFYNKHNGDVVLSSQVMRRIADIMESTGEGLEAFYKYPVSDFVTAEDYSGNIEDLEHGKDILDVWFDSGVCHTAVQLRRENLQFPADIYLEGSDQHRGWFQTSLLSSLAAHQQIPFNALITHGFVNDAQGFKMSKSKGNVIDPHEINQKMGAEILRLWVAYEDYGQDVTVGNEMFKRISETYRRIRNTMRFLLGNLSDFDPDKDQVSYQNMPPLDRWALGQLNQLVTDVTKAYDSYDLYKVYHALNYFFTVDLSATYLDILKDRLYTWKQDGIARRSSQTVLLELLNHLLKLMAPILSFLAEETYRYLPGEKEESIFLTDFPQANNEWIDDELRQDFSVLLEVRSEVSRLLEDLRKDKTIGSSLDAQVKLKCQPHRLKVLEKYRPFLREFFIVSQIEFEASAANEVTTEILTTKAEGTKCIRCWHYSIETNSNSDYPGICPKCIEALS